MKNKQYITIIGIKKEIAIMYKKETGKDVRGIL